MHSRTHRIRLIASILLFRSVLSVAAQPRITEFLARNDSNLTDGDGGTPDWIEIHNPDSTPLNLSGYHLTDDPAQPTRYPFPPGTSLAPGEHLIVFASGQDSMSYTDDAGNLHTNFSLRGGGEYLALNAPDGSVIQEFTPTFPAQYEDVSYGFGSLASGLELITENSPSTWLAPDQGLDGTWQLNTFDDTAWQTAESGIGYDYPGLISSGGDTSSVMLDGNPSVYQRIKFQVASPGDLTSLILRIRYDDGFIAYLNGTRVAAANAPSEGDLNHTSLATALHPDSQARVPESFILPVSSLVTGDNVLAIRGLNRTTTSSDLLILSELSATVAGESTLGYFLEPTPGQANTTPLSLDFVADTRFSHKRGYYNTPFDVEITTATPGATILYTTDGTPPSDGNGSVYTTPLTISESTTLRAIAIKNGFRPTNIDTQTYLFVSDIVRQTQPTGYPSTWSNKPADYAMDPAIVNDPDYADSFETAFAALPTVSLVFEPDALFDSSTGIYQNPQESGSDWERPLSVEFFLSDGSEPGFQVDAGIRIQGGSSRNADTPKHAVSLRFRSQYGAAKLRHPLFETTPDGSNSIGVFDTLQLRPEYNFGWMHRHWYQADNALYGRDQWASDLFNGMGQNGSHGRWVHLFFNGIYWGLYDLHERPDADHMANYFGGEGADYDTVNSSVATNGDLVAYNEMMDLAYGTIQSASTYAAIQEYLDLDAFIDYMILNAYVGNRDWDGHNWRAARKREPGAPWLFFPWDTEFAASHVGGGSFDPPPEFETTTLDTNVLNKNGNRRPTGLQQRLALNPEYRLRYADRVRAHFFNGGPMTPESATRTWTARSDTMHHAIVAESARWGDFRRDVNSGSWTSAQFDLYTRNDHYLPSHAWFVDSYLPERSSKVLDQMRDAGLYPSTAAPEFSQHGGRLAPDSAITLSGPDIIFYTLDGSDPRQAGGAANPSASELTPGTTVSIGHSLTLKARSLAPDGEWSALTEANFTVGLEALVVSEIMYHPASDPLAEFLEIHNTGPIPLSLAGLRFTEGILFDFDQHSTLTVLGPDARLLLVRHRTSFASSYGLAHEDSIAGQFQEGTALSNDGETLTLMDSNDEVVLSFTYNDVGAWPGESDGGGHSMVSTGGDLNHPQTWRPSSVIGGNPSYSDATTFPGGSLEDYLLVESPSLQPTESGALLQIPTHLTADQASFTIEQSTDLEGWTRLENLSLTRELMGDIYLITAQLPPGEQNFVRLLISER